MLIFREDLSLTDAEVSALEQKAKEAVERIQKLKNVTDNLKAEYIKITSASKSASQSASNATDIAKDVDKKHIQLEVGHSTAAPEYRSFGNFASIFRKRMQKCKTP